MSTDWSIGKVPRFTDVTSPCMQRVERVFHVSRSERPPIVKFHAVAQVKNVGARVGRLPALGEIGHDIHLRVELYEAVVDQSVEVLRLRVGPDPRIEIGGHRLDQEIHGAGLVRLARAVASGGEDRDPEQRRKCEKCHPDLGRSLCPVSFPVDSQIQL